MASRETTEAFVSSTVAALADALAIWGGLVLAMWIRFESGLISLRHPPQTDAERSLLAILATTVLVVVFWVCGLYKRPQQGRFEDKIPRLVKAILLGFFAYLALEAAIRVHPPFSRKALVVSIGTVTLLVLLERYLIYRLEWNLARKMKKINRVLIVGTDAMAQKLAASVRGEPFLRSIIAGFLPVNHETDDATPPEEILGKLDDLPVIIRDQDINRVILSDISLDRETMVDIIVTCEKNLVDFKLVPDLFRILTSGVVIQELDGIPVMGLAKWPLDSALNRIRKRTVDILGAIVGLILSAPFILICGIVTKLTSPGPIFYKQERYGDDGKAFTMHKMRTMKVDAEKNGPGWTQENDPRRTRIGCWMRKWNIDETPQFWDVLIGRMSLVGPRPERPVYVEQFKEEISRYMVRHVSKPGMTGWAQVNGLRGDTCIAERIKYDIYYLENWSLSLDFKIIMKTVFAQENAY